MNLLETWVHTPWAAAMGWTLVHSLWEGALVALVLAGVLGVVRTPGARYLAACVAMLALLGGLTVTLRRERAEQSMAGAPWARGLVEAAAPADLGDGPIVRGGSWRARAGEVLPWLAPLWMVGVVVFQLRGVAGWMAARRMRRRGVCAAGAGWQERMERLAVRARVSRPVVLLESCLAEVPVVIGYVRPVILMPVGLLAGLPAEQIECILLHELAHIRRHDYLVNLMQTVVEGLVFYHPAVWWISARVRAEREDACDDAVVAMQGDARGYAAALAALEENRGGAGEAMLAATGGSLVRRVRRLLLAAAGQRVARARMVPAAIPAAILAVGLATAMAAWQTGVPARPAEPARPASPAAPVLVPAPAAAPAPAPAAAPASQAVTAMPAGPYKKWLNEDVAYIIAAEEREAFQRLPSNAEREHFIEQFWLRRDPTPGTVENEFKEEHYRRIAYANEQYGTGTVPGWRTDRGRVYITFGPPDEKESHPAGGAYQRPAGEGGGTTNTFPFEQWRYRLIAGVGTNVVVEFVDRAWTGEYRMAVDPREKDEGGRAAGDWPPADAAASQTGEKRVASGSAMVAARVLGKELVEVSLPLVSHEGHLVRVYGRVTGVSGAAQVFEASVQGPAESYRHTVRLGKGTYRIEVVVKDTVTGEVATDSTMVVVAD